MSKQTINIQRQTNRLPAGGKSFASLFKGCGVKGQSPCGVWGRAPIGERNNKEVQLVITKANHSRPQKEKFVRESFEIILNKPKAVSVRAAHGAQFQKLKPSHQ